MYTSGNKDFPKMKTKAAETKDLTRPLLHCWNKWMDRTDKQHKQVRLMLQMVEKIEGVLEDNKSDYKLPDDVYAEFRKSCQGLVQINATLGHHYHSQKMMLFHCTIKWHYVLHLALLSRYENPRFGSCYTGECMMQVAKTLVQSCHLGSPPHLVVNKVMRKYAHGLGMLCQPDVWKR